MSKRYKSNIIFTNLALRLEEDTTDEGPHCPLTPVNNEEMPKGYCDLLNERDKVAPQSVEYRESPASRNLVSRRSSRVDKGVPNLVMAWTKSSVYFFRRGE